MSRKYKFHNPEGVYFVSFAVQDWVDVFTRNEYKNLLVDNLKYCQEHKGLEIFAWCVMTNHIHLIIRTSGKILLQDILRDYKKFTSKAIIQAIADNIQESRKEWLLQQFKTTEGYRFWRGDNHGYEPQGKLSLRNPVHQGPGPKFRRRPARRTTGRRGSGVPDCRQASLYPPPSVTPWRDSTISR